MSRNEALVDYRKTRRSVGIGFLAEPGPSPAELEEILTIGTRVPDHGKFAPWRLVIFDGDARAAAGEALAAIASPTAPKLDEAGLALERRQFLPAPLTIGVIFSQAQPEGAGNRAIAVGRQCLLQPLPRRLRPGFRRQLGDALVCLRSGRPGGTGRPRRRALRRLRPHRHADDHGRGSRPSDAVGHREPLAAVTLR